MTSCGCRRIDSVEEYGSPHLVHVDSRYTLAGDSPFAKMRGRVDCLALGCT